MLADIYLSGRSATSHPGGWQINLQVPEVVPALAFNVIIVMTACVVLIRLSLWQFAAFPGQ